MIECIKRAKLYGIHIRDTKSPFSDCRIITGTAGHPCYYSASKGLTYLEIMSAGTDIISDAINLIIDEILEDMARDMKFLKIGIRSTDAQKMSEINSRLIELAQAGDLKVEVNGNVGTLGSCGIATDGRDGITTVFFEWTELHDIAG
jgi:hypothetical protein